MHSVFSDRSFTAIREFSRNLGLGDILPVEDGSVSFEFDQAGTFSITPVPDDDRILLSLAQDKGRLLADGLREFLSLSGWDPVLAAPVNAGMSSRGEVVLVVSLGVDRQTLQTIELALDRLIELQGSH
ncbi:Tir chaperone protein (CesT) [Labrenzia sp. THAF82]|uniref:CesT family type III secretion system chaperone n=1 Tax=Labrenzia sp. THAF82 TaxID=2587861 RepID=UPI0012A7E0C7|nr:CesT family type III secretion system chaperone [Labrenzia sp. THAF82]QFT34021.1 Tir chaperone protein (CesT) [Labrenzia sp. THAF82]